MTDEQSNEGAFHEIVSPMVIERILFEEGSVPVFLDGDETVIGAAKFVKNAGGHMEITINCTTVVGERFAELMNQNVVGIAIVSTIQDEDKDHPHLDGLSADDIKKEN